MLYQIVISEYEGKLKPRQIGPVARDKPKQIRLKTRISIKDTSYWQDRIAELISDCELNEHATVMVAKE